MKRLLGYRKKIVSLMCAVMIISIGVLSTSFYSNASEMDKGRVFDLNYAEPSTGEHQGYICLYTVDSSGVYGIVTYFWNTIATVNSGYESPTYAYLTINSNSFKFQVAGGGSASGFYSITQIGATGNWWNIKNSATESFTSDFGTSRTILGFHYKGNVGTVSGNTMSTNPFTVYFCSDSSAIYLRDVWDLIHATYYQNEEMISDLEALYSLQSNRLSQVVSWLESINGNSTLIDSKLYQLIQKGNEILDEQKKTNTWLGKIWDSIQEFVNPSNNDSQKTDDFNNESNAQKSEIDDLNEQNQVDKVDVDSATAQVDANIDYDNMAQYGGVLATITNNSYVLQMILIVVSIGIIAYVLFGKR